MAQTLAPHRAEGEVNKYWHPSDALMEPVVVDVTTYRVCHVSKLARYFQVPSDQVQDAVDAWWGEDLGKYFSLSVGLDDWWGVGCYVIQNTPMVVKADEKTYKEIIDLGVSVISPRSYVDYLIYMEEADGEATRKPKLPEWINLHTETAPWGIVLEIEELPIHCSKAKNNYGHSHYGEYVQCLYEDACSSDDFTILHIPHVDVGAIEGAKQTIERLIECQNQKA